MKKRKNSSGRPLPADHLAALEDMAAWKKALITLLFFTLVLVVLMPELFFQDRIFLVPDTKAPMSFASVGRKALDEGVYPLWNPYLFSGMPSFSSMAYNPFVYPVSWITHIMHKYLFFPQMTWLLLHYFMAGIGVMLLLRSFGLSFLLSLFGGMLFIMLPNYLAMGANGHGSQACSVAYMPFALLLARRIFTGGRRSVTIGLLAITLGLQMLRGHVQISYYTYLLLGLLFIFESYSSLREGRRKDWALNTGSLVVSFILAAGIASILVFPLRHYAQYSIRGGSAGGGLDFGYAAGWSLHPKETLTFLFPWAFGYGKATYWGGMPFTDYPNYLGVVTVLFATAAMFLVKNRAKWFLFTTAVLATLLSYGKHFPLYGLMFRYFPFFNKFRVPVMVLIVQQLAVIPLMGMGIKRVLEYLDQESERAAAVLRWALIASAALILIILISRTGLESRVLGSEAARRARLPELAAGHFSNDLTRIFVILAFIIGLLYTGVKLKLAKGYIIIGLGLILFIDLFVVSRPVLHPDDTWNYEGYKIIHPVEDKNDYSEPDDATRFMMNDKSIFRIFPAPAAKLGNWSHNVHPFSENKYMVAGLFSTGGYHAAKLQIYQDLMDSMFASFNMGKVPLGILNMLNTKYIYSTYPLFQENSTFQLVWEKGQECIYENRKALPRVFFVDKVRVMGEEETLSYIISSRFDPSKEVVLAKPARAGALSAGGSSAEITDYGLNSIEIEAHTEQPCLMVVSEIYYPEWKAFVDGEEKEILRADYCLRAIELESGDHTVRLEYRSPVIRASLAVSIVAFVIAIVLSVAGRFWPKRKVG